jgi:alkanesulfonate monooxygenase SsuD/methylene tetrahydromethanopterin reductase-like flavin-dependent oxidoreductase (luciferase family)
MACIAVHDAWNDLTGVSDRLVDAVSAVGDVDTIAGRVRDHLDAGADHVLVSSSAADMTEAVDQLERLAPALHEVASARTGAADAVAGAG